MTSKPFFRRNSLLRVLLISLVLFVGIQLFYISSRLLEVRHQKAAEASRLQALANRKPEEKAVEKAQQYLKDNISRVDPATRLILDYVQRRFNLDKSLNKDAYPITTKVGGASTSQEIDYILRIAYPDNIHAVSPGNISNTLMITNIYSANCDHLNPPAVFWKTIRENVDKGGYLLTHNALAFAMLKDNDCPVPDNIEAMKPLIFSRIAKIAEDKSVTPDLRYEAAALLFLNSRHDLVEKSWIDQIVKEQRTDGGWTAIPGEKTNDPHATLLAMWAILEYQNPDKPYEPLIRRPSPGSH